jgi:hypothetical protein
LASGLVIGRRPIAPGFSGVYSDDCRKSGPQTIKVGLPRKEHNLDGHSLDDLGEVAGRIVGWQECELGTAGWGKLLDLTAEHSIWKCINPNISGIAHVHVG